MKIENLKIKENISFDDKVMAVDYIVGRLFEFDEDGFVSDYAPYYMEPAQVEAIVTFFMEGISFEDGETIYDSVIQNEEVNAICLRGAPAPRNFYAVGARFTPARY